MTLKLDFVTIDAHDPKAVAAFWVEALEDYEILEDPSDDPDEDEEVSVLPRSRKGAKLLFIKVPDDKAIKNRLHFDLRPENAEQDSEVERLMTIGATKVDIGQGDARWTVLADPEGNEFCVLRRLTDEEKVKYSDWAW
ncbi:MAG: VOC family protein [Actinobacteria bacterium]|nr:VOC family protein [Actinomycetota bacterium]